MYVVMQFVVINNGTASDIKEKVLHEYSQHTHTIIIHTNNLEHTCVVSHVTFFFFCS